MGVKVVACLYRYKVKALCIVSHLVWVEGMHGRQKVEVVGRSRFFQVQVSQNRSTLHLLMITRSPFYSLFLCQRCHVILQHATIYFLYCNMLDTGYWLPCRLAACSFLLRAWMVMLCCLVLWSGCVSVLVLFCLYSHHTYRIIFNVAGCTDRLSCKQ